MLQQMSVKQDARIWRGDQRVFESAPPFPQSTTLLANLTHLFTAQMFFGKFEKVSFDKDFPYLSWMATFIDRHIPFNYQNHRFLHNVIFWSRSPTRVLEICNVVPMERWWFVLERPYHAVLVCPLNSKDVGLCWRQGCLNHRVVESCNYQRVNTRAAPE